MKSIEIIVPRKLIVEFLPHPESYGDYVVKLQNGMYTDVYYNEIGDYSTITNDQELILYLRNQEVKPTKYFFRNGVFAFKEIEPEDSQLLSSWRNKDFYKLSEDIIVEDNGLKIFQDIPHLMLVTFKWIEVGLIEINNNKPQISMSIYEESLIDVIDIDICLLVIKEYLTSKLLKI